MNKLSDLSNILMPLDFWQTDAAIRSELNKLPIIHDNGVYLDLSREKIEYSWLIYKINQYFQTTCLFLKVTKVEHINDGGLVREVRYSSVMDEELTKIFYKFTNSIKYTKHVKENINVYINEKLKGAYYTSESKTNYNTYGIGIDGEYFDNGVAITQYHYWILSVDFINEFLKHYSGYLE